MPTSVECAASAASFATIPSPLVARRNSTMLVMPAAMNDTTYSDTLCKGAATLVSRLATGPYKWSNGDTTRSTTVTLAGVYFCTARKNCHYYTDTIHVLPTPRHDSLHEIVVCKGNMIDLTIQSSLLSGPYLWSDGAVTRAIRANLLNWDLCV